MINLRQVMFTLKQVAFVNRRNTARANEVYDALKIAAQAGIMDGVNVVAEAGATDEYIDGIIDGDLAFEGVGPNRP